MCMVSTPHRPQGLPAQVKSGIVPPSLGALLLSLSLSKQDLQRNVEYCISIITQWKSFVICTQKLLTFTHVSLDAEAGTVI